MLDYGWKSNNKKLNSYYFVNKWNEIKIKFYPEKNLSFLSVCSVKKRTFLYLYNKHYKKMIENWLVACFISMKTLISI